MFVLVRSVALAAILSLSIGCGNTGPAEVPKNPVAKGTPGAMVKPPAQGKPLPNAQAVKSLK